MLLGMNRYSADDWSRLGAWVAEARRRAGRHDTKEWAGEVGRSTRQLLGLERGESVGPKTLEAVAAALDFPVRRLYDVLAGDDSAPERRSSFAFDKKAIGPAQLVLLDRDGHPVTPEERERFAEVVQDVLLTRPAEAGAFLQAAAEALQRMTNEERGGGEDAERSAAIKVPESGPADQPDRFELAASEEEHAIEDEQGHDETP